jgi:hypothetical protein
MRSVFLVVLVSACATSRGNATFTPESANAPSAAVVVQNGHCADISVYAMDGRTRVRLGTVEMFSTRTFIIPRAIVLPSELNLYVLARIDGQEFTSPTFLARNGDFFMLNVENATQFSTLLKRQ